MFWFQYSIVFHFINKQTNTQTKRQNRGFRKFGSGSVGLRGKRRVKGKFEVGKFEVKTKTFFDSIIAYYDIKIIPCQIMYFCNMRFN